jgi:hypothetical protein
MYDAKSQNMNTVFEKSKCKESATYFECIDYYKKLDRFSNSISLKTMGLTDAGYPLHLVLISKDNQFNPVNWHKQGKVVILINNGIHPGEPDGIDASMMLARDIAIGKIQLPNNVVLGIIPVYNIGGCLNRNTSSRVNQDGPLNYGFRGNSQNLDLNRDFIKSDSKEAKSFTEIFHYLNPDILVDNHVSDGADYQHTMTLLTTQQNKLGGAIGTFLHDTFEPALFKGMEEKNWPMCPYVNFETANPDKGWIAFYDAPRYSSGYAALFATMAFVPETHMLKPFDQRVKSTYALMQTFIENAKKYSKEMIAARKKSLATIQQQQQFPLAWKVDSSRTDQIAFMGYEAAYKKSDVTGINRLFYDHSKPFTKQVKYYNYFIGEQIIQKPKAYIIQQGWYAAIDLLKLNKVAMQQLKKDTTIEVTAYKIDNYKAGTRAYEKHFKHSSVSLKEQIQKMQFLKGDYIIYTGQIADRFLVETLEPEADDSYFKWNFFDAILQQKEGYSDYRWEDVAAKYLEQNPELRTKLEQKKKDDAKFAASTSAQLDFVYKNSPYYEPVHLRYPVYKLK